MSFRWNEQNTLKALNLWNLGESAADVARAIGAVSRSAICGKMDRLRKAGVKVRIADQNGANIARSVRATQRANAAMVAVMGVWTQPMVSRLIKMWNDHEPTEDICEALGVGAIAIKGKVRRLRQAGVMLVQRVPTGRRASPDKIERVAAPGKGIINARFVLPSIIPNVSADGLRKIDEARIERATEGAGILRKFRRHDTGQGVTLLHRRAGVCCFPTGGAGADMLFCAEVLPRQRSTDYCATHRAIMYTRAA